MCEVCVWCVGTYLYICASAWYSMYILCACTCPASVSVCVHGGKFDDGSLPFLITLHLIFRKKVSHRTQSSLLSYANQLN